MNGDGNVKIKKKRGRKPKKKEPVVKIPKKRGRKPKGGKIILNDKPVVKKKTVSQPNIILHLKCKSSDIHNNSLLENSYDPNIKDPEGFSIDNNFKIIESTNIDTNTIISNNNFTKNELLIESKHNEDKPPEINVSIKNIWKKLDLLKVNLRHNHILDKRSNCHWCTCSFDNPSIYIPSKLKDNIYEVYGCFCTPECAAAYLLNENLDKSIIWERYSMLNNIYSSIYDRNIKPAPNPLYTLNKFYGSLTIQEYRKLLENDKILMVVNKPMCKVLPELYEDNHDIPNVFSNLLDKTNEKNTKNNEYRLQSKNVVQDKYNIFNEKFSISA
ncbi:MAG: hypothetical protein CBB97_08805 [Candidatus Endolissoclinum sp. TMED37]|nr:MAG: hypothetical protein CBB97_08805 [Candidatus Endolissoclinum sp. TMED37]